jgi:lysophospholipid acyltransferase (LPLAT)-like uncharacterized protein
MTETDESGSLRNTPYRKLTRSRRRMTPARRLAYRLIVPLGLGIVRFFWATCRIVRVEGAQHLDAALARAPSLIPCYWHGHQLFCARYLLGQASRGLKVGWLVSPSVDGEIGALMVNRIGGHVIRGSATHTGARALRDYYDALVREGISPALTPDGPRGPRYRFKPGAILLAQISGRPIVLMSYAATRAWRIKWDRFVIPVPFSNVAIAVGAPRYVGKALDGKAVEQLQGEMEGELLSLFRAARTALAGAHG